MKTPVEQLKESISELVEGLLIDITNIDTEDELRESFTEDISKFTISILQGEIDRLKIEKIKPNWNGQYTSYDGGYNQAISDQINHLEEKIKKIKKEKI